MTTSSGDPVLLARCLRAEAALAVQREMTRVLGNAWRELQESLSATPRVQLAIQIQERMQREIVALQQKTEVEDDDALW